MQRIGEPMMSGSASYQASARRRPNFWLRLASAGWDGPQVTVEQREALRRSQLTAWILLGLLVADLLLIPAGLGSAPTLMAIAVAGLGILVAIALNRFGFTTAAGILLIVLIIGAVIGAVTGEPGGLQVVDLPAYDLLVIAIVIAASILPPLSAFLIAAINVGAIILNFSLQTPSHDLAAQIHELGILALLARPIALQVIIAAVAYLWVRGTQDQIRRADRAEEIAQLEGLVVEQKRALDLGVQELTQAFIRAANGDYNVRVNIPRQNPLWSLGAQMNTFIQRLQQAGQASFELERTRQEAFRLAAALDDWRAGRMPLWPAPSGTVIDTIIQRLSGGGHN
ncbi:MAG TPA: hypothetical protein VFU60_00635 [Ktedonobacterales bacterium]|nr:hypothetical protein [Ktedonobacterales bacterium]